ITPSKNAGIGSYTLQQFSDALRTGVRADGARLYPAMPYTAYALVTDDDVTALYAYFMQAVNAVDTRPPPTRLPFPFNLRWSMAAWNMLFLDSKPFTPDPGKNAQWNRGAYLVRGLGHCGTCHTPRNLLMAENVSREFGGAQLGPWYAPNITSDANSGIGGWQAGEIVDYLHAGHAAGKAQAAGPMAEAVDHSLQYVDAGDLQAIASFLKTTPALHDAGDSKPVYAWGQAGNTLDGIRGADPPKDSEQWSGAQLYDAYCATCHQASGEGSFDGGLPSLFHNTATGRLNTDNLVMTMLDGIDYRTGAASIRMPGFAAELSDAQVAKLGSFLLKQYGNPEGKVTPDQVRTLRAGGPESHLVSLARLAMVTGLLLALAILVRLIRRKQRRTSSRLA
ncbi:MAG: c-type cytochrome, partial [Rudaea sp.]